ncbi:hypothetical protein BDZ89DRAFT_1069099 [Hymenopellis radicata]|nr:hypothetical protein BDZ89DRAFT_1069099 [Hymenopellis radicata]
MTPVVVFLLRPSETFRENTIYGFNSPAERIQSRGAFLRSRKGVIGNAKRCSEKTLRVDPALNSSALGAGSLSQGRESRHGAFVRRR